jgi:hypothetical protein
MQLSIYVVTKREDPENNPSLDSLRAMFSAGTEGSSNFNYVSLTYMAPVVVSGQSTEYSTVLACLLDALGNVQSYTTIPEGDELPDRQYVMIVKDSAVSTGSSSDLMDLLYTTALMDRDQPLNNFDLLYVANACDKCEHFMNRRVISSTGTTLVDTQYPHSTVAMVFSPHGSEVFQGLTPASSDMSYMTWLVSHIKARSSNSTTKFIAEAMSPPAIDYDVSMPTCHTDFLLANECQPLPEPFIREPINNTITFIWVLFLGILILVIIAVVIKINDYKVPFPTLPPPGFNLDDRMV